MAEYIDKAEALSRFSFYNGDRIPERDVDGFQNTITFHDAKAVIRSIRPADVRPVEQLRGYCFACKHYTPYHNDGLCATCKHERACFKPWDAVDRWQWRGPQKKG